jgi:hypothetical protein
VQNQEMVEAKVIGGQFFSFIYLFDYLSTEVNQRKTKRCNYPNSLTDKEKAIRRGEWLVQFSSPFRRKMQL